MHGSGRFSCGIARAATASRKRSARLVASERAVCGRDRHLLSAVAVHEITGPAGIFERVSNSSERDIRRLIQITRVVVVKVVDVTQDERVPSAPRRSVGMHRAQINVEGVRVQQPRPLVIPRVVLQSHNIGLELDDQLVSGKERLAFLCPALLPSLRITPVKKTPPGFEILASMSAASARLTTPGQWRAILVGATPHVTVTWRSMPAIGARMDRHAASTSRRAEVWSPFGRRTANRSPPTAPPSRPLRRMSTSGRPPSAAPDRRPRNHGDRSSPSCRRHP